VLGDLRYVNAEEYAAFKTLDSESLRERFLRSSAERAQKNAQARGEAFDPIEFRSKFLEQVPLASSSGRTSSRRRGATASGLRQRPVMVKINGVVFVHGGLTPEVAALGCEAVNDAVRREITRDIEKTRQEPMTTLAAGETGPLWYRGFWKGDEGLSSPRSRACCSRWRRGRSWWTHGHRHGSHPVALRGRVIGIDIGMVRCTAPAWARSRSGRRQHHCGLPGRPRGAGAAAAAARAHLPGAIRAAARTPRGSGPSFPTSRTARRGGPLRGKSMRMKPARAARKERALDVPHVAGVPVDAAPAHEHPAPLPALDHLQDVLVARDPRQRAVAPHRAG